MLSQRAKLLILLSPSLASALVGGLLSLSLMLVIGLSYQAGQGTIYNYLFGKDSSAELIASSQSTLEALNNTILGNSLLNKILYFVFWMTIGLIVYIILYAVMRGTGEAAEDLKETTYANIKRSKLMEDFARKSIVRLAAISGFIVFNIVFLKFLLPFSSLAAQNASEKPFGPGNLVYGLMGFAVLVISFHVEVVLMRLILLRVRIFNQQEISS